jgi:GNAT superfamily N-acetyltransferase
MPAHARDIAALMEDLGERRTRGDILSAMGAPGTAWHVAEAADGAVLGVQWIEPAAEADTAEIATFTAAGPRRIAVGSVLFEATRKAARRMGYRWLLAEIAPGNGGALAYYGSRGFETGDAARRPGRTVLRHDLR